LVTERCGSKAFRVLSSAGILVFSTQAPTIAGALRLYRPGRLKSISGADVESHW